MNQQDQTYQIRERLAALEVNLNEAAPGLPTLLKECLNILKADPDVVTLLSDDEAATLVRGLKKQTSTEIATTALKGGANKALSKMTVSDL